MYNLFISHSWAYGNQYEQLIALLDTKRNFEYRNYSIPRDNPIPNVQNDRQLKEAIQEQMEHASCVLILAGVYASYSKWINIEIDLAKQMRKSIIAVEPWGAKRTSDIVKSAAHRIVKWNTNSIVDAIRECSYNWQGNKFAGAFPFLYGHF